MVVTPRLHRPAIGAALLIAVITTSCHDNVPIGERDIPSDPDLVVPPEDTTPAETSEPDVVDFDVRDTATDRTEPEDTDAEVAPETTPELCPEPGLFQCPCAGNGDCLDGLCIEGPDGSICSRPCVSECPDGYDCRTTSLGGNDPIAMCVPNHSRLCRPCRASFDCQSPFDPLPAACVPAVDPADGSFCATSCAQRACPTGYTCEDVEVEDGVTSRVCLPLEGDCACRPAWAGLGFVTACTSTAAAGACGGTRTCGPEGLTACNAREATEEVCNGVDDDCNGLTDDITPVPCANTNDFGSCEGMTACAEGETICNARQPSLEICNGVDDNCDGQTDEAWSNCPPARCTELDDAYFETGAATCEGGTCAFVAPRPCGLFTCVGGGDAGDVCATECSGDAVCVIGAHCDLMTSRCVPDRPAGAPCDEARECASGYCNNGFCCEEGDCCAVAADCPSQWTVPASCDVEETCQGSRRDAQCVGNQCVTSAPIDDDRACTDEVFAVDCSPLRPRFCTGQVNQEAPSCPSGCSADADCVPGFFCDEVCVPQVADGEACGADNECVGGRCQNGFCCPNGDCCQVAADCPASWSSPPACLDTFTCQGERVDALCIANQCASQPVGDDSRCDALTEALDCGPYTPVFCNGEVVQQPPRCVFSCGGDEDCDTGFHCNSGVCVPNLPDGMPCGGDSACISGYCNGGLCCSGGDCCNFPQDCPASYSTAPTCDVTATCQGTRTAATCTNKVCGSQTGVADDSACTSAIIANDCGPYPAVRCNGQADQSAPQCATSCQGNSDCAADAWCDAGQCKPKQPDGTLCGETAQCQSGHCQNGFCCESGDCCATAANCSQAVYGSESTCLDATQCRGERSVPACVASRCEVGGTTRDDSGCAGLEADGCGYYNPVFCSAATSQTAPSCPTSCTNSNQCAPGANCSGGECVPDEGAGGACTSNSQCGDGLTCVDGVCCTSTCGGTCQACNLPGSEGICTPIPNGQDPDAECGAVACTGYYWGFDGNACHASADISASVAACNGAGACQAPAQLCPSAPKGALVSSCHGTCQSPAPGTCSGTTPPQCNNISGGTQTCGEGACTRTVARCQDGAPATCTPGSPQPEVCDGIDNSCNGLTDGADPDLVLALCDNQQGVCGGSRRPADLCVGGQWQSCTQAVYANHSPHYQHGTELSCDGRDNDCDGQTDEDFTYTSPANVTVQGAGQSCGTGVCAGGTTQCGPDNTLLCSTDNLIAPEICDGLDNDCDGRVDSNDPSLVLIPCQNQQGVCQGSVRPASLCASGSWQLCTSIQYSAHSPFYEPVEVSCDGRDNNCNGQTDTGLTAPLNDNQLGVCQGSRKTCTGGGGWQNRYDNVPFYDPNESAPDGNFRDENCDGIDGNVNEGIFVATNGSDSTVCGLTMATPCRTVQYAINNRVSAARRYLYVRAGTYGSSTSSSLNISQPVQIFGGYNTSWVRAPRTTTGHLVTLTGQSFTESGNTQWMAVRINGVGTLFDPVRLADLRVTAVSPSSTSRESDGSGKSSYAIHARSTTLIVERSEIIQGNGATGANGNAGTSAPQTAASSGNPGNNGTKPCSGSCDDGRQAGGTGSSSSCSSTTTRGGNGGAGGRRDINCTGCGCGFWCSSNCNADEGLPGQAANVSGGGFGGGGSTPSGTCITSQLAGNGQSGRVQHGSGGEAASNTNGLVPDSFWRGQSGGSGSLGAHGAGGGGGGGAAACNGSATQCDQRGARGGGGGAGGCRATAAGQPGAPGGGSFGVFAIDSLLSINNTTLQRGTGGDGGRGGNGGLGQPGGSGGAAGQPHPDPVITRPAGSGGAGGLGGHSGGGAGGAGGAVYGIFRLNGSASIGAGMSYQGGARGNGGAGGTGGPTSNPITSVTGEGGPNGALGTVRNCSGAGGC